ncbi:MBL fold metallo-hydrolase [Filobacillus milosensis]|uniref:MBL fold metallo-hydrolase n=1 Tax=Filobacillus milosensis TaxID=94137 RepID=UPI003899421C
MSEVKNIPVKELAKKIFNGEEIFILDVRGTDAFDDWKVEGKNVDVRNQPFSEFKDDLNALEVDVPKDEPFYVICAKGKTSSMAAEKLADAGYDNVYSVEGGMQAFSEHLEPIEIGSLAGGKLYQFVRIGKGCLSYLIESNGEGAIIDANRMINQYDEFLNNTNINIKYVIDTHLHADHISGGKPMADEHDADYYLPPKDASDVKFEYKSIEDGDEIKVGDTTIKAYYSPGHTIGSTSYIVDDQYLMTGDILFIDSIGRPDLAGKAEDWVGDLRETLYSRYKKLSQELLVLPAHYMSIEEMNEDGSVSEKLGQLYKENHGLNIEDEDEFRHAVADNLPPQPNSYEDIRKTNMGQQNPEDEKQREMETGPNRCAIR